MAVYGPVEDQTNEGVKKMGEHGLSSVERPR